jgi:hypothetical protein
MTAAAQAIAHSNSSGFLYPFGLTEGDIRLPTGDDNSSPPITLSVHVRHFSEALSQIFVNNNGIKLLLLDISFLSYHLLTLATSCCTVRPFVLSSLVSSVRPQKRDRSADRSVHKRACCGGPAGATSISVCSQVQLRGDSSTGNSGRPFAFLWDLPTPASSWQAAAFANLTLNGSELLVPTTLIEPGSTTTFRLSVTNWLGVTANTTVSVFKSSLAIPEISISGPNMRTILRQNALKVIATASVPPCVLDADRLQYT